MGGHEAMITAGIGCRRGCPASDIIAVLHDAQAASGVLVDNIAVTSFKSAEPGLLAAIASLALTLIHVDDAGLRDAQPHCVTRSPIVARHTGHASIAEAAALAGAGPGAVLRLPRIIFGAATCALAEA